VPDSGAAAQVKAVSSTATEITIDLPQASR
jgi:hypothetical protein